MWGPDTNYLTPFGNLMLGIVGFGQWARFGRNLGLRGTTPSYVLYLSNPPFGLTTPTHTVHKLHGI